MYIYIYMYMFMYMSVCFMSIAGTVFDGDDTPAGLLVFVLNEVCMCYKL